MMNVILQLRFKEIDIHSILHIITIFIVKKLVYS
jgi:hypothetical protein